MNNLHGSSQRDVCLFALRRSFASGRTARSVCSEQTGLSLGTHRRRGVGPWSQRHLSRHLLSHRRRVRLRLEVLSASRPSRPLLPSFGTQVLSVQAVGAHQRSFHDSDLCVSSPEYVYALDTLIEPAVCTSSLRWTVACKWGAAAVCLPKSGEKCYITDPDPPDTTTQQHTTHNKT